ncbi:MAG: flagellar hook-length control protein FliK [Oscillospiraceae bacterium]|nr:flagellar hook-length control protein FliK [Oscillospiraceae bacterium]
MEVTQLLDALPQTTAYTAEKNTAQPPEKSFGSVLAEKLSETGTASEKSGETGTGVSGGEKTAGAQAPEKPAAADKEQESDLAAGSAAIISSVMAAVLIEAPMQVPAETVSSQASDAPPVQTAEAVKTSNTVYLTAMPPETETEPETQTAQVQNASPQTGVTAQSDRQETTTAQETVTGTYTASASTEVSPPQNTAETAPQTQPPGTESTAQTQSAQNFTAGQPGDNGIIVSLSAVQAEESIISASSGITTENTDEALPLPEQENEDEIIGRGGRQRPENTGRIRNQGDGRMRSSIREAVRELRQQLSEAREARREENPEITHPRVFGGRMHHAGRSHETHIPQIAPGAEKPKAPEEQVVLTAAAPVTRTEIVRQKPESGGMPTVAQQIETEIIRHIEQGKMEFRMQLQPAVLGKIDIKMVLEGGKLVIQIITTERTHAMLARHLDQLVFSLRENHPSVTSVQVVTETARAQDTAEYAFRQNQGEDGRQNGSGQQRHGLNLTGEDEEAPAPVVLQVGARILNYSV